jgi:hypothetical protein
VQEIARKSMTTATETDPFSLADTSHVNNQRHMKRATKSAMIHSTKTKDDLVKTAMWLTRSETLLSKDIVESSRTSKKDIENEMKSIASLIDESSEILSISKKLPNLIPPRPSVMQDGKQRQLSCPDFATICADSIGQSEPIVPTVTRKRSLTIDDSTPNSPTYPMKLLAALSSIAEPLITNNTGVAEDATVFVNFLHSVNNGQQGVTESLLYLIVFLLVP